MTHSDTTISIVTHTAFEECKRTLRTVLEYREGAKLVLTANANPEAAEYFETLARQRENIEVVVNTHNLGFIQPNNFAFAECDTDYFVLLNDDAVPPNNWLDCLKSAFIDRVAIAGPGARWLDRSFVGKRWQPGFPNEPDFIEGSCLMVKTQAFRDSKEPLFWPELKLAYCEDAEMALRMRALGYEIAVTDFPIQHKSGTTTRTVPELHDAMRRNFVLCEGKWRNYLRTRTFA